MKVKYDYGAFPIMRAHFDDAGIDFRTPVDFILKAGQSKVVDTGVHVQIPVGYFGKMESKSGLNVNSNIQTTGGVIDSGYRGSVKIRLTNNGSHDYGFKAGDKISQMVLIPVLLADIEEVKELDESNSGRDNDGFGSTGR